MQEITRPNYFWYDAATKVDLPFNIVGLVLFQLVAMHWVETKVQRSPRQLRAINYDSLRCNLPAAARRPVVGAHPDLDTSRCLEQRGLDIQKPNSQNRDPIFTNYSLPEHTPGYPVQLFGHLLNDAAKRHPLRSKGCAAMPTLTQQMCTTDDQSCKWLQGGIFAPVIPGDLEELKLKELKNGRLAM